MDDLLRAAAVLLAAAILVATWQRARTLEVSDGEARFFRFFNNGPDAVHIPVWAVMQAGSFWAVWVVAGVLEQRDESTQATVTFIVGVFVWAGVKRLKPFVGRGRPAAHLDGVYVRGQAQTGLGYPSGHAAVSLTLALVATQGASIAAQLLAIGVAAFTGGARMYVGAHLPLDVAGGFAIGVIVGEIANAGIVAWG